MPRRPAWGRRPAAQPRALLGEQSMRARSRSSREVFKLTPAQRIAALVRRPRRRFKSMVSSMLGQRIAGMPSIRSRPGSWQTTMTSGWLPCSRPSETPHRPGGTSEPCPSITSQCCAGASGLSISAAPASKSATTASIGMPPPAIRMPVCPVARKSASTPRCGKRARQRKRGVFLAERAVGADREQALAGALAPRSRSGYCCGGVRTSISRRPWRSAALFSCGTLSSLACMPLMMSSPDSSASISEGIQLSPITPPGIGHADDQRARAARARLLGRQARQSGGDRGAAARPFADAAIRRPSRAARTPSWRSPFSVVSPRNSRYG